MHEHPPVYMPCGSMACFDHRSGISYRCMNCFAVIGSIGMPLICKEQVDKYTAWERLGGKGWDYSTGKEKQ